MKIISGGQTGVDQAALIVAGMLGLETGGWAPSGWLTENGCECDWLREMGLKECARPGYAARTEQNVRDSDGTLIISHEMKLTGGTYDTLCCAESMDKPVFQVCIRQNEPWVTLLKSGSRITLQSWIGVMDIRTLNVAGPRASKCPWLSERVIQWLVESLQ